jgi:ribosomal protein S18 acetylase RimI-like enzyme
MNFEWASSLRRQDMHEMVALMNAVAVRETTLGFEQPLGEAEGLALMQALDADLRRGASELLLARAAGGRIVGMLTLARQVLPARRHIIEMRRCVIDPEHRGQFLLQGWEHAVARACALGCEVIVLEVRSDGPEPLWRRLGFREYGRLPDYARVRGEPVLGHFMYARIEDLLAHHETAGSWLHEVQHFARTQLTPAVPSPSAVGAPAARRAAS